jgi:uncharacterized protein YbcI
MRLRPGWSVLTPFHLRDELIEAVEEAMGRKVIAFMSQNHIDPDLAVEIFILEPDGAAADSRSPAEPA